MRRRLVEPDGDASRLSQIACFPSAKPKAAASRAHSKLAFCELSVILEINSDEIGNSGGGAELYRIYPEDEFPPPSQIAQIHFGRALRGAGHRGLRAGGGAAD
jgi:hypothetical protein